MRLLQTLPIILALATPVLSQEPKLVATAPAEQHDFLKVVPADALVVVIPNQERGAKRIDELQKEVGFPNFGISGEAAMSFVRQFMGANSGVDESSPLLLVVLDPSANNQEVVFGIPIGDLKELLSNYKVAPEDVADGKLAVSKVHNSWTGKAGGHVTVRGSHLWFSPFKETLEKTIKLESPHDLLTPARRAELANAGIMIHVGAKVLDAKDKEFVAKDLTELLGTSATTKDALTVLQHLHSAQATLNLTGGVNVGLQINFDDKADAEASLNRLFGEGQSTINGLPDGNMLVAGALHGTAEGTATFMGASDWSPLWFLGSGLSSIDTSAISSLFGNLAAHIDNTSVGWYLNDKPDDHGTMSLVSILDPAESPEELVKELKSLSTFVNARTARELRIRTEVVDEEEVAALIKQLGSESFQTRQSAASKLRIIGAPALPALEAAAKSGDELIADEAQRAARRIRNSIASQNRRAIANNPLAALEPQFLFRKNGRDPKRPIVEVLLKPSTATTKLNQQMTVLFGPEWKRLRLAIMENHVIILFGSDMDLLDRTIAQVKSGAIPRQMQKTVEAARTKFKGQRLGEWHFSMPAISRAYYGEPRKSGDAAGLFSTITFLKRKVLIRTDIHALISEIKAAWGEEQARRNR